MYIKFNRIHIGNFGSVGEAELELSPGIFQVKGINLDNVSSNSNGSGKSTIFSESFRWVIYGSTSKKLSSDGVINDIFDSNCFGILELDITDDSGYEFPVRIERYRKHETKKNSIVLIVDGRDETKHKMSDTQKEIEELIKLPINVFSCVYLMEQGLSSKFTSLSNVESKNYIESLRNIQVWNDSYFRVKDSESKLNKKISEVTSIHDQNYAVINSKKHQVDELDLEIIENNKLLQSDSELPLLISKYTKLLEEFEKKKSDLVYLQGESSNISENIQLVNSSLDKKKGELNLLERDKLKLEGKLSDTYCSSCGREFDNIEEAKFHIEKEIKDNKKLLEELRNTISKEEEKKLSPLIINKSENDNKVNALKSFLESRHKELLSLHNEIQAKKSEKDSISSLLNSIKKSKEKLSNDIIDLENTNKEVIKDLDSYNKELPYYNELKLIFSFKGIRSFLIMSDIEFLNSKMREFSTILFSDMIVQLFPSVNNEGMVTTLDVIGIFSNKKERLYNNLSGGEKRRSDLCVQLAIREFVRSVYNVDTNLFSLDEIFEGLDKDGISSVMELINDVSNPDTTIFVISHRGIDSFNGRTIQVVKENGITKITE